MRATTSVLFAIAILTIHVEAQAQQQLVCGVDVSRDQNEEIKFSCTQPMIDFFWNGYSMEKQDWAGKLGFDTPCDGRFPLARTFNGMEMLHFAAPVDATTTGDFNGNVLHWGGNYALREIDELNGACGAGIDNDFNATTLFGGVDDMTVLYTPFFYNGGRIERAATLIHEARHADWCGHSGNDGSNKCPARHPSCDENWNGSNGCDGIGSPSGRGASGYGVEWLIEFLREADSAHATTTPRAHAADRANEFLDMFFDSCPGFIVDDRGKALPGNVCGP